ncbi:8-oxo-dGTP diphosphatase [bacterium]|nr:8-oxo-dGTP diphosphatase [bacterium]
MKKEASLSIVEDIKNHKFLMIKHLRGVNKGFINFSGGKKEEGESIEDCVKRETFEETGITIINPKQVGYVEFYPMNYCVSIFKSTEFTGKIKAKKDEVEVFWQDADKIPYDKMREADRDYLPEIFAGKYVNKKYTYDENGMVIDTVNLPSADNKKSR